MLIPKFPSGITGELTEKGSIQKICPSFLPWPLHTSFIKNSGFLTWTLWPLVTTLKITYYIFKTKFN